MEEMERRGRKSREAIFSVYYYYFIFIFKEEEEREGGGKQEAQRRVQRADRVSDVRRVRQVTSSLLSAAHRALLPPPLLTVMITVR